MIDNEKPLVSVIIPFHQIKNQRYLDLCLKSLLNQTTPFEIIVISGCETKPWVPSFVRTIHQKDQTPYGYKINLGIEAAHPESKYIFLAQDDLVFSRGSLDHMVRMLGDQNAIINPLSNCDNGWLYHVNFDLKNNNNKILNLKRFMRFEDIEGHIDELLNFQDGYDMLFKTSYVATYATLIPKTVINVVGKLDERFENGYEDTDYCLRALQKGVYCFINMASFIFHFGGATSSETMTDPIRLQNHNRFMEKWGIDMKQPYVVLANNGKI